MQGTGEGAPDCAGWEQGSHEGAGAEVGAGSLAGEEAREAGEAHAGQLSFLSLTPTSTCLLVLSVCPPKRGTPKTGTHI